MKKTRLDIFLHAQQFALSIIDSTETGIALEKLLHSGFEGQNEKDWNYWKSVVPVQLNSLRMLKRQLADSEPKPIVVRAPAKPVAPIVVSGKPIPTSAPSDLTVKAE